MSHELHHHEKHQDKHHHDKHHQEHLTSSEEAEKKRKLYIKNKIRLAVDILMLISFAVLAFTAYVKMPFNYDRFFTYEQEVFDFKLMSLLHDYSGIVFLGATVAHLILSRRRLQYLIKHGK
ncbi:MAG: hypothetical protein JNL74_06320 [Fibrobacteres bacterium]|nr:hypothetical protein [Fibrobacterota bacterium]